jgi:hypothetical protein
VTLARGEKTNPEEFSYVADPNRKVNKAARFPLIGIRTAYDGTSFTFYCYKGDWVVRFRHWHTANVQQAPGGIVQALASFASLPGRIPVGLAFASDGNLFLADGGAGRVLEFHPPGVAGLRRWVAIYDISPLSVAPTSEPGAEVVVKGASPVSGTVDGQRMIALAVPLIPDTATTLEAWTIGRGGEGLGSPSAATTVVHDGVAIDLQSPVPGHLRHCGSHLHARRRCR